MLGMRINNSDKEEEGKEEGRKGNMEGMGMRGGEGRSRMKRSVKRKILRGGGGEEGRRERI